MAAPILHVEHATPWRDVTAGFRPRAGTTIDSARFRRSGADFELFVVVSVQTALSNWQLTEGGTWGGSYFFATPGLSAGIPSGGRPTGTWHSPGNPLHFGACRVWSDQTIGIATNAAFSVPVGVYVCHLRWPAVPLATWPGTPM